MNGISKLNQSNVEANNLSWRHLQFLVDSRLQVLVEQRLQLFVLLVEESGLLNEILTLHQLLVIVAERFVEGLPYAKLLRGQDGGHLLPVDLLLTLLPLSLLLLSFEVALLLGLGRSVQLILNSTVFAGLMERVKRGS